jgi:hypothetical protein
VKQEWSLSCFDWCASPTVSNSSTFANQQANAMSFKGLEDVTSILPTNSVAISFFHRVWPPAAIVVGLILTVIWIGTLGYGLFKLAL